MSDEHGGPQPDPGSDREQQRAPEAQISNNQGDGPYRRYRKKAGDIFQWMREAIRTEDATRNLAIGTWFLAIGTWALAVIGYWALDDSRIALETTQRAWVGPENLHIDGTLTIDQPLHLIIDYHNTGRQPALDFFYHINPKIFTIGEDASGEVMRASTEYMTKCRNTPPSKGYTVIYPTSGFSNYSLSAEIEKDLIDWNIIYGTNIIVISGCFVYKTANVIRHSGFCYFFQNGRTRPTSWNICRSGNYAD